MSYTVTCGKHLRLGVLVISWYQVDPHENNISLSILSKFSLRLSLLPHVLVRSTLNRPQSPSHHAIPIPLSPTFLCLHPFCLSCHQFCQSLPLRCDASSLSHSQPWMTWSQLWCHLPFMWPGVLVSLLFPLIGNCQYYTAFGIHFLLSPQILDSSYAPSSLSLSSLAVCCSLLFSLVCDLLVFLTLCFWRSSALHVYKLLWDLLAQ